MLCYSDPLPFVKVVYVMCNFLAILGIFCSKYAVSCYVILKELCFLGLNELLTAVKLNTFTREFAWMEATKGVKFTKETKYIII